jgi:hypothetical protein
MEKGKARDSWGIVTAVAILAFAGYFRIVEVIGSRGTKDQRETHAKFITRVNA